MFNLAFSQLFSFFLQPVLFHLFHLTGSLF